MAETTKPAKSTDLLRRREGRDEGARQGAEGRGAPRRRTPPPARPTCSRRSPRCRTPDRDIAERIHALVKANAPVLTARTWYGQPAYAKDGKVICFFQASAKFKTRYSTLGFSDDAKLDDGAMWPTSFALTKLTAADEERIAALVKKAVS